MELNNHRNPVATLLMQRTLPQTFFHAIILWCQEQEILTLLCTFIPAFKKYDPILRHLNPVYIFKIFSYSVHFNIFFPPMLHSSKWYIQVMLSNYIVLCMSVLYRTFCILFLSTKQHKINMNIKILTAFSKWS